MTEAQLFAALADESRLRIVQMIGCESYTVNEIAVKLNLTAVMISHHLKTLRKAGVVIDNKEGRCVHNTLNSDYFHRTKDGFGVFLANTSIIFRERTESDTSRISTKSKIHL